jgi:hypothetical protein
VSNPEQNTLNRITLIPDPRTCSTITYYRDNNILTDGEVKTFNVPYKTSDNTFNYEMSGFSGIYGVAVDPRNHDLLACDAELDRIYRFSHTGEILKTFELSSLNDWDPQKKMCNAWTWRTPTPEASSTSYAFYTPAFVSSNPANYIVTVGGLIVPADYIQIDTLGKTIRILARPKPPSNYPPEDIQVNAVQLFNPLLPQKYISSLMYWTTSSPTGSSTFPLTGSPSLSANSGYYIVSVNGVVQAPTSYNISNTSKTITFTSPVCSNHVVHTLYVPYVSPPATWTDTYTNSITAFSLTGSNNYIADSNSEFIVNVGGVFQDPNMVIHDIENTRLIFETPIPASTPISITQFSIPETLNQPAAYTPAYVSLDKEYNIWVSLFNAVSVLKFDPDFNLLFSVVPKNITWAKRTWTNMPQGIDYQSSWYSDTTDADPLSATYSGSIDPYTNEFFLKPPVVETDQENNCWVTYAHPLCSILVKYSNTGSVLSEIALPTYSTPINIAIDVQNNVWIANQHGSSYTFTPLSGSLQRYDTNTYQLLDTVNYISRPDYLSIDRNNNLWFSHGQRRIGYYNTTTSNLSTWTLNLTGGFTPFTLTSSDILSGLRDFDHVENSTDEDIGGLAVDVFNRVWILDNLQNFAWVISATPLFEQLPIRAFKIVPNNTINYVADINTGSTYTETGDYYFRSAQANGDWTGNRWYQKYATLQQINKKIISGISEPFTITPFQNENQIRRVNESFNTAGYYKSLALPENLNSNPVLFDQFFAAVVGTGTLSANEDIGQITYERIANFFNNHADIDTCNIDQLLSLADQTGVIASDYGAILPSDIKNYLDITSIPRSKLWGIKDNVPLIPQSIGDEYNTQTDFITAGTKMFLKNKFDGNLSLINVPPYYDNNTNTYLTAYPLINFYGPEFAAPVTINYLFYKFKPVYTDSYIENIIDWDSEYTTLSPTTSTVEEWYGDNGAIESAFRYLLTKNLFLK